MLSGCRKGPLTRALIDEGPARRAAPTRAARRSLRPRQRRSRALGPRGAGRRGAQRRAGRARHSPRRRRWWRPSNVHYATPDAFARANVLSAIRARQSLEEMEGWLSALAARAPAQRRRAASTLRALARGGGRAGELAVALAFDLRLVAPNLPPFPTPAGMDEQSYLEQLVAEGATQRYGTARARARAGGVAPDRPRARRDRGPRLRRLLPHGVGHHRVLPAPGHLLPGARLGGQLGGLLLARHHQRRRGDAQPVLRALPVAGARRPARTSTSTSSRVGARR